MKLDSFAEFAKIYFAASDEQRKELRNINDAHAIVCEICHKHNDWLMYVPILGIRRWRAYEKMCRVARYLYARRMEALR